MRRLAVGAAGLGLLVGAPLLYATTPDKGDKKDGRSDALAIVGLTADQRLVTFSDDRPGNVRSLGAVTGLVDDGRIVGIDYRPATGDLYGVGDKGGVYTFAKGAAATLKSRLSIPLVGTEFGVDFNPAVDRLRVVSDTGQNLRDNVDADGDTIMDGTLTYPGAPPAPATTATGVSGAAYTNNDSDPMTGTTLFDLDSTLDQVVIQAPANAGLLSATGKLGVDAGPTVGFDIYSTVRGGSAVALRARATLNVGGRTNLYSVSLLSGRAYPLGTIGGKGKGKSSSPVVDIAIPLNQL